MAAGEVWTVRKLLLWTAEYFARKDVDQPRLSSEILLTHVLGWSRVRLYTEYDRRLEERELAAFRELVRRAADQEPVAYLTGRAGFFGLELKVTRDVLIPRPDTETLVEHVLQSVRLDSSLRCDRILDLCTGSGCVAVSLASRLVRSSVVGVDVSESAAAVARENAALLGVADRVTIVTGDLYEALSGVVDGGRFDLIVANPPYIRSGLIPELDRSVRDFEPHVALDGGPDGLGVHRRILTGAAERLNPGGGIWLEIAYDQGESALALARQTAGLREALILTDAVGNDRVLVARRA